MCEHECQPELTDNSHLKEHTTYKMRSPSLAAMTAQFFFPQRHCLMCGAVCSEPGLCAVCAARMASLPRCDICAAFIDTTGKCSQCAEKRPLFIQTRAAAPYEGKLRDNLLDFKYLEKTWLRRPLSTLLIQVYECFYRYITISAVVPVPLAPLKFKERGYNQSAMLAKLLARELGLDYRPELLKRVLETPPLAVYDGEHRRKLLKQAFAALAAEGQTVLLVDDIYTSGATLNACTEALLLAGAHAVYGITVVAYDERKC